MANKLLKIFDVEFDENLTPKQVNIGTATQTSDMLYKLHIIVPNIIDLQKDSCYVAFDLPNAKKSGKIARIKLPYNLNASFELFKVENGIDYYHAYIDLDSRVLKYVGTLKMNLVIEHLSGEYIDAENSDIASEIEQMERVDTRSCDSFVLTVTRSSNYEENLYPDDEEEYDEAVIHIDAILKFLAAYQKYAPAIKDTLQILPTKPNDISNLNGLYYFIDINEADYIRDGQIVQVVFKYKACEENTNNIKKLQDNKLDKTGGEISEEFRFKAPKITLEGAFVLKGIASINDETIATVANIIDVITRLKDGVSVDLDTLNKLAKSIGDDPHFIDTMADKLSDKADLDNGKVLKNQIPNMPLSHFTEDATHRTVTDIEKSTWNNKADINFVNSSIATSTANYKGTVNSVERLNSLEADENDYAYVVEKTKEGNTVYNRYKFSENEWRFEYQLNQTYFTAAQFDAINSGITKFIIQNIWDTIEQETTTRINQDTSIRNLYNDLERRFNYTDVDLVLADGEMVDIENWDSVEVNYVGDNGTTIDIEEWED